MSLPHTNLHEKENLPPSLVSQHGIVSENLSRSSSTTPKQPIPPRSAFMCFTNAKKHAIMSQHGIAQENNEILNLVAEEWKTLSKSERGRWDEEARNDRLRFEREKSEFKGPWNIPKRRAKKHPLAPKRPMSAFLKFSKTRRAVVKRENPDMSNTDVSRLLGEMWRNASTKERSIYIDEEKRERAVYKENIQKWREDQAKIDAASRSSHHSVRKLTDQPSQEGQEENYHSSRFAKGASTDYSKPRGKPFEELSMAYQPPKFRYSRYWGNQSNGYRQDTGQTFHQDTNYNLADAHLAVPELTYQHGQNAQYSLYSGSNIFGCYSHYG